MKKCIRLKEADIRNMVRKAINEISYRKAYDVADKKGSEFEDLKYRFYDFYETLLNDYGSVIYPSDSTFERVPIVNNMYNDNKYFVEIMKHASAINDILERKVNQVKNINNRLEDFDSNKYWDSEEGQEEDYEDKELNYLINKYPKK